MKISVIIPMYNESSIIEDSLKQFQTYMEKTFEDFELIFVDDGSKDGCSEAVKAAEGKLKGVRLVRYEQNKGKGYAVRTGHVIEQSEQRSKGDTNIVSECCKHSSSSKSDCVGDDIRCIRRTIIQFIL